MLKRLTVLFLITACLTAGWFWYSNRPNVWLERMLGLPNSMSVEHCCVERSRLFQYANACCDVPCTEGDFRSWQASIRGVDVEPVKTPFGPSGMSDKVPDWWIATPNRTASMFIAKREGLVVIATWSAGRAFVDFGQRGQIGSTWGHAP